MKRRVLAVILTIVLLLSLAACNKKTISSSGATTTHFGGIPPTEDCTTSTLPPETEPEVAFQTNVQLLPETVENPEGLPVLKWVCLTEMMLGGGLRAWNEMAAIELNQMLAEKNMPFRVQFFLMTSDQYYGEWEWLEQEGVPELLAEADLIYGYFSSEDMQKYLHPITEYAVGTAQPSLKNAVPHAIYWGRGRAAGEVYGIAATTTPSPLANGWYIKEDSLANLGLSTSDFNKKVLWEMDDCFAAIYQKNGNMPFLSVDNDSVVSYGFAGRGGTEGYLPAVLQTVIDCRYQCIGACFAIDYSQKVPTVVNYLDTDYIRNCQAAITRYKKLGYTTYSYEDSKVFYTSVRANFPYLTPDYCIAIPSGELRIAAGSGNGFVSGISATSEHQEEALSLLAFITEDEEFRMQLFYGKEGRDYVLEDGYYVSVKQNDGSRYNLDFLSCLAYFSGLSCRWGSMEFMRVPSVDNSAEPVIEGKTLLQTHQTLLNESVVWYPLQYAYSASAFDSGTLCFDFTGFEQELAAMQEIYNYYFHFFTNHQEIKDNPNTPQDESLPEMTQEMYQQMLEDLKAAGSDRILAELQRQLTQWQNANQD